jgi:hypothetical protein
MYVWLLGLQIQLSSIPELIEKSNNEANQVKNQILKLVQTTIRTFNKE